MNSSQSTPIYGGALAQRGYALNKMCYSFNDAHNRAAFVKDEEGYCAKYGLTEAQRFAVKGRDMLAMLEAGGTFITWPSLPAFSG